MLNRNELLDLHVMCRNAYQAWRSDIMMEPYNGWLMAALSLNAEHATNNSKDLAWIVRQSLNDVGYLAKADIVEGTSEDTPVNKRVRVQVTGWHPGNS